MNIVWLVENKYQYGMVRKSVEDIEDELEDEDETGFDTNDGSNNDEQSGTIDERGSAVNTSNDDDKLFFLTFFI